MNKVYGVLLILAGSLLLLISILALVSAFDVFSATGGSAEDIGYAIGSIIFPLLLTVFGRWVFRKGVAFMRK